MITSHHQPARLNVVRGTSERLAFKPFCSSSRAFDPFGPPQKHLDSQSVTVLMAWPDAKCLRRLATASQEEVAPQNLFLWNPHWQCFVARQGIDMEST